MIDSEIISKLRARYPLIHPLMFHRSLDKAKGPGDLFDILDTMPEKYPVMWDETQRRWATTDDILQAKVFLGRDKD